jgi:hypothetical protein
MKEVFQKKGLLYVTFIVIIFLLLVFFHFRGVTYYDEGYILNAALRVAHGQIPYKDFDMVYTPFSFVYTSVFLKLFGESLFAERLGAFVISLFSLFAIYLLLKLITKNGWLILASLLFFVSWGPTHINFAWPVMFAICFLLYALYFYLLGINQISKRYFFFSGVMTVLVFLSKQNFGTGVFLVFVISFFFLQLNNKKKLLLYYILGTAFVSGLYLLILASTGSLSPFIQNVYLYTLKRVILDKGLDTPFLYEGSYIAKYVKLLFYISPLIISLIAFLVLFNKHKKLLFIPLAIAVFYLLGVRPTTDYVHVSPLIAISFLPLTFLIIYTKKGYVKNISLAVLLFLTGVGFYTAYFKGYYQWEAPIKDYTYLSKNPRMQIFLTERMSTDADALQKYVDSRTKKEEYIFVNYYSPLVYFITNRDNPTPYDLININQLPSSYQYQIIQILKQKKVKLVMLHYINKDENSIVSNYIRKNYHYTKTIAGFIIFEK